MAQIIIDIAERDPAKRNEILLRNILPVGQGSMRLSKDLRLCKKCGKIIADVFTIKIGDGAAKDIHVIYVPSTRLVVGIHPKTRDAIKETSDKNIGFGYGESLYFCEKCFGWPFPELLANFIPVVKQGLSSNRNPIVDSDREIIVGQGCWLTMTEFSMQQGGPTRLINFQTNFRNFVRILGEMNDTQAGLVKHELLKPHLPEN